MCLLDKVYDGRNVFYVDIIELEGNAIHRVLSIDLDSGDGPVVRYQSFRGEKKSSFLFENCSGKRETGLKLATFSLARICCAFARGEGRCLKF